MDPYGFGPSGGLRTLLGKDRYSALCAWQEVLRIILLIAAALFGVGYICHWTYRELALESSYRQKYGTTWKAEFEHYHGSLSHAHTQLAICSISMVALMVVLFFAWRKFCRPKTCV